MKYTLTLLLSIIYNLPFAATPNNTSSSDSTSFNSERTYSFGIDYGSNTSFKGVKQDTIKQQHYFLPNFTYSAKSGIFLYAGVYYLPDKDQQQLDAMDLSAGYDFKVSPKAQGSISYTKSLFSETSPQVNSTLTNDVQLYFKKKILSIKSKIAFDYYFGTDTDYSITWSNSRSFTWEEVFSQDDAISFAPKIKIIAGSQNFYYTKNPAKHPDFNKKGKQKGGPQAPAPVKQVTVYEFGILSYIFTLPLNYSYKDFIFQVAANYSAPGGLSSRPGFSYFTFSINYTL
jgi:hypothetical protein